MAEPLLNIREMSAACGLALTTLREWVIDGKIVPAVRGSRGRGHAAMFTAAQARAVKQKLAARRALQASVIMP